MTKEELRKEATATIEWKFTPMIDRPTFVNGYIVGAESKEKRIAELEEENAFLRRQFERIVNDIRDCVNPDARYNVDDLINEWDIELED